ncbi:hypothetical protein BVRB_5g109870 [Beta vulgaris subsp. vulgaris]|nr:hypothetical protein BVRB_5g109870 [Beta vulgaris subsp. vulgaris]
MEGDESTYESSFLRSTPSTVSPSPSQVRNETHMQPPPPPSRPPLIPSQSSRSRKKFSTLEASQGIEENEGELGSQSAAACKSRKLTSPVWDHFERLTIDEEKKAKCIHCEKILPANSTNGTSHLKDHLNLRCSKKNFKVDIHQKLLNVSRKSDGTCSVDATNFNQEVSRKELANMVIMHEYPLAIVDHAGFRRFVSSLNPSFKIISRPTLRADIMKMFTSEKVELKKLLENSESKIVITTDMWTASNQKKGYMVVTAHYIDQYWVLRNKTLR